SRLTPLHTAVLSGACVESNPSTDDISVVVKFSHGTSRSNHPTGKEMNTTSGFGREVKGLRAKITLKKPRFLVGEPIQVHYVVRNVASVAQTIWHSGFWPNHLVLVKEANGKEAPLTGVGQAVRHAFAPDGVRDKNFP